MDEATIDPRRLLSVVVAIGVLHAVLGLVALVWPDVTLTVLTVLVGIDLALSGVLRIVVAVGSDGADSRVLRLLLGLVSVVLGLVVIRAPLESLAVLVTILGVFWVLWGLVEIVVGVLPAAAGHRAPLLVEGAIAAIGGGVLLAWPDITVGALTRLVGLLLLLAGIVTAWSAWRLRQRTTGVIVVTT